MLKNIKLVKRKEFRWRGVDACLGEQGGQEGADGCQEEQLHLNRVKFKSRSRFLSTYIQIQTKSAMKVGFTSVTSVLSPSLVTKVQEEVPASLEIACRWASLSGRLPAGARDPASSGIVFRWDSLSSCGSIFIQVSKTTDFLS